MQEPVHIFLADDDADDRGLFYEAIRGTGSSVELTLANNGDELLESLGKIQTAFPRIIFLDLNMPIKNGHEALRDIRNDERLKSIPVYIYSTSTDPTDIDKSFEEGADFYIAKPSSFSDLKYIIKSVLGLNRKVHLPPAKESFVLQSSSPQSEGLPGSIT
jgi:CheY-like chemotaxis protein